jgi:uncharacterized protein (TIRG00374 family)
VKKHSSFSKRNLGLAYVLVVAVAFVAWALHSGQMSVIVAQLGGLDARFLWLSVALLLGYLALRALTLYVFLKSEGTPISFVKALAVTGVGQFYSAITPSSSGGQPLEVLSMTRWGVPGMVATAAVSVQFICFQAAMVVLGAALWIACRAQVALILGGIRWFVILGFVLNAAMPLIVLLLGVHRPTTSALTRAGVWVLTRLRIVRDREAAQRKIDRLIGEYQSSVTALFKKPALALKVMLLSFLQIALLMAIIVGVYRVFHLSGVSALTLITLQTLLYIGASFMPLPGGSGAQEYGFSVFFAGVFPSGIMLSAIFVWRFFTYYLLLLIGFVSVLAEGGMRFLEGEQKEKIDDGTP